MKKTILSLSKYIAIISFSLFVLGEEDKYLVISIVCSSLALVLSILPFLNKIAQVDNEKLSIDEKFSFIIKQTILSIIFSIINLIKSILRMVVVGFIALALTMLFITAVPHLPKISRHIECDFIFILWLLLALFWAVIKNRSAILKKCWDIL